MLSIKLAWRNLFRNTRRTILTCLLISSALIVLILTDGIILGMRELMVGNITGTLEGEAQINRKGFRENYDVDLYLNNPSDIISIVERAPSVSHYAPRVIVGGMIASTYNTTGGLIFGVDAEREVGLSKIKDAVYEGHYLTGASREILIGKLLAELLEVTLDDRIIITAAAVDTNEITQELFRVTGLVEFGPEEMDESFVFINLSQSQTVLGMEGRLHQIALRFVDPEDANNPELPLYKKLNTEDVEALGWLTLQPSIGGIIGMTNYATAIVGVVLLLLTSLGVINAMFMSIYERIYEFGVAKAIGTRPGQIIQLVLLEALFLALLSCIFGLIFAYFSSSYFSENGIPMGRMEVSGVVLDGNLYTKLALSQFVNFPIYVTLLTVLAAIYPAIFASKIVPTRALQRAL